MGKDQVLGWIGNSLTRKSTEAANGGADPDCFHTKPSPGPLLQGQDKTSASVDYRTLGQNCDIVGVNWMQLGAAEVHQQHQVFEYFGTAGRAMFTMFELTLAQPGGKI